MRDTSQRSTLGQESKLPSKPVWQENSLFDLGKLANSLSTVVLAHLTYLQNYNGGSSERDIPDSNQRLTIAEDFRRALGIQKEKPISISVSKLGDKLHISFNDSSGNRIARYSGIPLSGSVQQIQIEVQEKTLARLSTPGAFSLNLLPGHEHAGLPGANFATKNPGLGDLDSTIKSRLRDAVISHWKTLTRFEQSGSKMQDKFKTAVLDALGISKDRGLLISVDYGKENLDVLLKNNRGQVVAQYGGAILPSTKSLRGIRFYVDHQFMVNNSSLAQAQNLREAVRLPLSTSERLPPAAEPKVFVPRQGLPVDITLRPLNSLALDLHNSNDSSSRTQQTDASDAPRRSRTPSGPVDRKRFRLSES